jgi:tryptophan-rich sensory protein
MAKRTEIDKLGWLIVLVLTIFFDPIVQGINRILRGKLIYGIIWIVTGGLFVVGWVIDVITMLLYKDIKILT